MSLESLPAVVVFGKFVALDHGAHGAVENHDALIESFFDVHKELLN